MLRFILAALCIGAVTCDVELLCECSVQAVEDAPGNRNQAVIAYIGYPMENSTDCDASNIEDTKCYQECQQYGAEFINSEGTCIPQPNGLECYGDVWCERILTANPQSGSKGTFLLAGFVRIPECENFDEWAPIEQVEEFETICCDDNGDMELECGSQECACDIEAPLHCECGVFIPEMFETKHKPSPGIDPLPLSSVGSNSNNTDWETECQDFPSNITSGDLDYCSSFCYDKFDELLGFSLTSPIPNNPGVSYGQKMCAGLKARMKHFEGIFDGANLLVYGRVKSCPPSFGWSADAHFGILNQKLCCNVFGEFDACPPEAP